MTDKAHGVAATHVLDRKRIVARALAEAPARIAAHPLDNDRLEASAAKWLTELATSENFLALPELDAAAPAAAKPAPIRVRMRGGRHR
jgi:hypothetical protein